MIAEWVFSEYFIFIWASSCVFLNVVWCRTWSCTYKVWGELCKIIIRAYIFLFSYLILCVHTIQTHKRTEINIIKYFLNLRHYSWNTRTSYYFFFKKHRSRVRLRFSDTVCTRVVPRADDARLVSGHESFRCRKTTGRRRVGKTEGS